MTENPADLSAFCVRCGREMQVSNLCRRGHEVDDLGADHDPEFARFEGLCRTGSPVAASERKGTIGPTGCCGHNHA